MEKVRNIVEDELTEKYSDNFNPALVVCGVGDMADGEVEAIWRIERLPLVFGCLGAGRSVHGGG